MITLDQLEALDLLLWSRSGADAAVMTACNQSSISRRVNGVLNTFSLQVKRRREFQLTGDLTLLRLQRLVHQKARFLGRAPLRLEATHYVRHQLTTPAIPGWILGPCHF